MPGSLVVGNSICLGLPTAAPETTHKVIFALLRNPAIKILFCLLRPHILLFDCFDVSLLVVVGVELEPRSFLR